MTGPVISSGARNCPFFTFTARPIRAAAVPAATSRSVCRHRNAGICSTSTTSAAGPACSGRWMSVVTGTARSRRMSARIRNPSSAPGPRADEMLVRLALSKDALNTNGNRSAVQISLRRCAIAIAESRDSMTHGPAMIASPPPPRLIGPAGPLMRQVREGCSTMIPGVESRSLERSGHVSGIERGRLGNFAVSAPYRNDDTAGPSRAGRSAVSGGNVALRGG